MAGAAASNLPSDSVLLFRRVREGDGRGTEEVGRRPVTEVDLAVDRELRRCLPADVKGGSQKRPPTTETASRSQLFGSSTPSTAPGSSSSGRVLHQRGGRGRRGSDRWRNREPRSRDRGRWSGGSWGELQRDTCQPTSDTPMRDHQGPGQSLGGRPRAMGSHRIGGDARRAHGIGGLKLGRVAAGPDYLTWNPDTNGMSPEERRSWPRWAEPLFGLDGEPLVFNQVRPWLSGVIALPNGMESQLDRIRSLVATQLASGQNDATQYRIVSRLP
jgi:hypothetical protein